MIPCPKVMTWGVRRRWCQADTKKGGDTGEAVGIWNINEERALVLIPGLFTHVIITIYINFQFRKKGDGSSSG